jgi:hypothetical protein
VTTKVRSYKEVLELQDWDAYLMARSGLPGPRGTWNWRTVAEEGDPALLACYRQIDSIQAPANTPGVHCLSAVCSDWANRAGWRMSALLELRVQFNTDPGT